MKTFLLIWFIIICICILEGYFYSIYDPETLELFKKREDDQKK